MERTNITIRIDSRLAQEAKVWAARHGSSVSRLVAEELERLVRRDERYEAARKRALERLSGAQDLGWRKPQSRDTLHERQ